MAVCDNSCVRPGISENDTVHQIKSNLLHTLDIETFTFLCYIATASQELYTISIGPLCRCKYNVICDIKRGVYIIIMRCIKRDVYIIIMRCIFI